MFIDPTEQNIPIIATIGTQLYSLDCLICGHKIRTNIANSVKIGNMPYLYKYSISML